MRAESISAKDIQNLTRLLREPTTTCFICAQKRVLVPGHVVCETCHNEKRCLKCRRARRMAKSK